MLIGLKIISLAVLIVATVFATANPLRVSLWIDGGVLSRGWLRGLLVTLLVIGYGFFCYGGAYSILDWMPRSWGGIDENGVYVTDRDGYAAMFALVGALIFPKLIWDAVHSAGRAYHLEHLSRVLMSLPEMEVEKLQRLSIALKEGVTAMPQGSSLTYAYSVLREDPKRNGEFLDYVLKSQRNAGRT